VTLALDGGGTLLSSTIGTRVAIASTATASLLTVARERLRSNHHKVIASSTIATSTRPTASAPRWLASTQTSHAAVRYIGKASTCFSVSIQRPGLGSRRASAGTKPMARNGKARPMPSARNTSSADSIGAVNAYASALPMNGAVHGLATTTASTPVKKSPAGPEREARWAPVLPSEAPSCTTPDIDNPTASITSASAPTTRLLQLRAPAQRMTRRTQGENAHAKYGKTDQHAGGIEQGMSTRRGPVPAALEHADCLDRQHRQHAGHQVQHQSAAESEQQGG